MPEHYFLKPIGNYTAARALKSAYCAALLLGLASFGVHLAFPTLKYTANSPIVWRIFSAFAGQLAHLGTHHLMLNLAAMALITWGLAPWWSCLQWLAWAGISAACVALGLLLTPDIDWYVGLSGLLHGLLVAGLVQVLYNQATGKAISQTKIAATLILLSVFIKLYIEAQWPNVWLDTTTLGGPVLMVAHRYGALGVLMLATLVKQRERKKTRIFQRV